MKNFACVGRRIRRFRFLAFVGVAVGAMTFSFGLSEYVQRGEPTRWERSPDGMETKRVLIPRTDPWYAESIAARKQELFEWSIWSAGIFAAGVGFYLLSLRTPSKEVLLLAQAKNGLLTLPEVSTTLDIDPHLAARALKELQKLHIASPRWQEHRKNLWEFPDYVHLPLGQSLDIAKKTGGRVSLKDLLAQGHSLDTAQQTMETLSREGLAEPDPHNGQTLIVAAQ